MKLSICGNTAELSFVRGPLRMQGKSCYALIDPPDNVPRRVRLLKSLKGQRLTEVIVHECLHLAGWHIDEDFVEQFASDVAEILHFPEIQERIERGE
jgi:hypothetical protein